MNFKFATVLLVMTLAGFALSDDSPPAAASRLRIGVYDSRAVAIAYVRGNGDQARLKEWTAALKEAESRGDKDRAAEIRARGARLQTLRHLQGFSNAPVEDIMKTLAEKLPAIAREANVASIVPVVDFSGDSVETVDITDRLVAEFSPDAATQKILAELKNHKPMPLLEALAMKAED